MPAHLKTSLTGSSVTIPVSRGSLALGTWQGIYLCEHRDNGGPRRVVFTAVGDER
jgi:secondary thiamine-phosphate synthase enzyme